MAKRARWQDDLDGSDQYARAWYDAYIAGGRGPFTHLDAQRTHALLRYSSHVDADLVTLQRLAQGMVAELEHGKQLGAAANVTNDDLLLTARIVLAHLMEDLFYYDRLGGMEQAAERYWARDAGKRDARSPELIKKGVPPDGPAIITSATPPHSGIFVHDLYHMPHREHAALRAQLEVLERSAFHSQASDGDDGGDDSTRPRDKRGFVIAMWGAGTAQHPEPRIDGYARVQNASEYARDIAQPPEVARARGIRTLVETGLMLQALAVAPAMQRRGIATALLKYVHAFAQSLFYDHILLHVAKRNRFAHALYVRNGYSLAVPYESHKHWAVLYRDADDA